MDSLHNGRRIGPLMYIFFAELSTLNQIARIGGVVDQTGGEELASVLKGGRIVDESSEVSADLDCARKSTRVCVVGK